ncbi:MAG: MGDG synthase family glycosyltransferase [Sulfobacillus sp.]
MQTAGNDGRALFLSATMGAGHQRAAEALAEAFRRLAPAVTTREIDFFEQLSPAMNNLIRWMYIVSVRHLPSIWNTFYQGTSRVRPDSAVQGFLNSLGREKLLDTVHREHPKVLINTFPTPAGVISSLRLGGRLTTPNVCVVTDHTVHSQWIHPAVDRYYVGSEAVRQGMVARGVSADQILATGIPVHPSFADPVDVAGVRARLGLGSEPVVVLMAGAYGMIGGFAEVIDQVVTRGPAVTYLALTGHDQALAEALKEVASRAPNRLVTQGYLSETWDVMRIADILVSKAGGLTTSEAMACGLPMAIFRPIPGQEMANVRLVLDEGAGFWATTVDALVEGLHRFFSQAGEREQMRQAASRAGRPQAAADIVQDLLARYF